MLVSPACITGDTRKDYEGYCSDTKIVPRDRGQRSCSTDDIYSDIENKKHVVSSDCASIGVGRDPPFRAYLRAHLMLPIVDILVPGNGDVSSCLVSVPNSWLRVMYRTVLDENTIWFLDSQDILIRI